MKDGGEQGRGNVMEVLEHDMLGMDGEISADELVLCQEVESEEEEGGGMAGTAVVAEIRKEGEVWICGIQGCFFNSKWKRSYIDGCNYMCKQSGALKVHMKSCKMKNDKKNAKDSHNC